MAKTGKIQHQAKREKMVEAKRKTRDELRARSKNAHLSEEERYEARLKLNKLPRNSAPVRLRNRCMATGRPRGYIRKFALCRIKFREMASAGLLPGVIKSSW